MRHWQREYFNALERLKNAEEEARGWKAMAMVLAESKDLLRHEIDNLERDRENERRKEQET